MNTVPLRELSTKQRIHPTIWFTTLPREFTAAGSRYFYADLPNDFVRSLSLGLD